MIYTKIYIVLCSVHTKNKKAKNKYVYYMPKMCATHFFFFYKRNNRVDMRMSKVKLILESAYQVN